MKICSVIVAFDPRKGFLPSILSRLTEMGVNEIIIVNNGNHDLDIAGHKVLRPSKNIGAPSGFSLGMKEALKSDSDYIWLLDDDNYPEIDALSQIVEHWRVLHEKHQSKELMLYSYRPQLFKYLHLSRREGISSIGPMKNSYLGFHYRRFFQILARRTISKGANSIFSGKRPELIRMDTGYFGGLFFHRSVIENGFLPDERFFIYWGDLHFTRLFHLAGGKIYLVCNSLIEDLDNHDTIDEKGYFLHHPVLDLNPSYKAFDYVRNLVQFEKEMNKPSPIRFINKALVMIILGLMAIVRGKHSRLKLLSRAIASANRSISKPKDF